MPFNKQLLRQVRKFALEQHINAWDQTQYFSGIVDIPVVDPDKMIESWDQSTCGSLGCIAGWGSIMGGWHQLRRVSWRYVLEPGTDFLKRDDNGNAVVQAVELGTDEVVDELGNEQGMHYAAQESFGLTTDQAGFLFASSRDRDELIAIFDAIEAWPEDQDSEDLNFGDVLFDMSHPVYTVEDANRWEDAYVDECGCAGCRAYRRYMAKNGATAMAE